MHILLGLLTAIGVVGAVLWRMRAAAETARDVADIAGDARGLFRGWLWRRKFAADPLDLVEDPREAAAAMLVMIAQADGAVTERERVAILAQIVQNLGATGEQAEHLLAHGRWLARDVRLAENGFRRLVPLLNKKLGPGERAQMVAMLRVVAAADAQPGRLESDAIERLGDMLNVN